MKGFRLVPPARLVLLLGSAAGLLAGVTTVALAGATLAERGADSPEAVLDATHLPPLLTLPGEKVQLAYEAFCLGGDGEAAGNEGLCDVDGTAFVRPVQGGSFAPIPLQAVTSMEGRRLVALVPEAIAASSEGFEYYAELNAAGLSLSLPAGGAAAPHHSRRLTSPVDVDLGTHVFGKTRSPDARVAAAAWGTGVTEVGLEDGRNLSPIGASGFDVDRSGAVYLLDEARHRILRWGKGAKAPARIPVSISGTLADIAVSPDGSIYVLETVGRAGGTPIARRFDADGRELERVEIAERTASQIRMSGEVPVVLEQPSHQWMPIVAQGSMIGPEAQRENGRVARPLPTGGGVIVLRHGSEIRVALTGPNGVRRSWQLHSDSAMGEVQLAEPLGSRLVVVARAYADNDAEFIVLVLGTRGLVEKFSLNAADWAEAAPLGRFKLVGSSLYRLGSTARGAFVDRFDLEVR